MTFSITHPFRHVTRNVHRGLYRVGGADLADPRSGAVISPIPTDAVSRTYADILLDPDFVVAARPNNDHVRALDVLSAPFPCRFNG
jgi:hypothetical protein